jgi:hypothetical protein
MAKESDATEDNPGTSGSRPTPKAILTAVVAALIVGLAAVGVATMLDDPVGEGARDAAPIVAGPVVAPGQELTGGPNDLPPLALVLDRPPPGEIGTLPAEDQVPRLQALSADQTQPRRLVELGAALQASRRLDEARAAFERALEVDSNDIAAQVGLALTDGAAGPGGLDQAESELADLEAQNARNQVITFNRGWVAIYRSDAETARSAWERTVEIAPETRLGQTASQLLDALERDQSGGGAGGQATP